MPTNFLTKEGFQKLQEELDHLHTAKRQEVAARLHEAMEGGELIENAEYEAAKNEQAFVEGRIQELELLLATAQIIEENGKGKKGDTNHIRRVLSEHTPARKPLQNLNALKKTAKKLKPFLPAAFAPLAPWGSFLLLISKMWTARCSSSFVSMN